MIQLRSIVSLAFLTSLLALPACQQRKNFGANAVARNENTKENPAAGTLDKPSSNEDRTSTESCKPGDVGITQVRLLSSGLSRTQTNQSLEYELSAVSCKDGSPIPLTNQAVWFDLDVVVTVGFGKAAPYTLKDAATGKLLNEGMLKAINGSDLFGNIGQYSHWETESASYSSNIEKIILEIQLENFAFKTFQPSAIQVNSYLKIGKAQAVTQQINLKN